jgi:hypothetical protein
MITLEKWMDHLGEVCISDVEKSILNQSKESLNKAYERGFSPEELLAQHELARLANLQAVQIALSTFVA